MRVAKDSTSTLAAEKTTCLNHWDFLFNVVEITWIFSALTATLFSRKPPGDTKQEQLNMKYLALCTFAVAVIVLTTNLRARQTAANQDVATERSNSSVPVVQASSAAKRVGFRLTEWKTFHSHSEAEAKQQIATLMKIGCEVKSENHGNHIDVQYRCVNWKALKLASDPLVNQWSTWCESQGMETVVINPPAATKKPTVRFRLPAAKTVHLHDPNQATQVVATLKLIGCEVSTNNHGNHIDATFSCPNWSTIELASEDKAHGWQKWLNESGFETEHTH